MLPYKSVIRLHVWRGVVISLMAFLFFYGLIYVPLAEANGLSFIAPLIALYLAAALFGWLVYAEKVTVTTVAGTALIVSVA